jgi:hypothetical protein
MRYYLLLVILHKMVANDLERFNTVLSLSELLDDLTDETQHA